MENLNEKIEALEEKRAEIQSELYKLTVEKNTKERIPYLNRYFSRELYGNRTEYIHVVKLDANGNSVRVFGTRVVYKNDQIDKIVFNAEISTWTLDETKEINESKFLAMIQLPYKYLA
jgi:hypothetical protein